MKKLGVLALLLMLMSLVAYAGTERIAPKVMVFTMFEIGKNTGDFPGEFQHWYEGYFKNAQTYRVKGAFSEVYVNAKGVAGTIIGEGKNNAAASVMAILLDDRFDFSHTYFLTSGVAGTPPSVGTLGAVFLADFVVDLDYSHTWSSKDYTDKKFPFPFEPLDSSGEGTTYFVLNKKLVDSMYNVGKNIPLVDSDKASAARKIYLEKTAKKKPFLGIGTTVCGDDYFGGKTKSLEAQYVCNLYKAGIYSTTEMEDSATATVLVRFGYLNRYISERAVSDFDQPHPGQTVLEALHAFPGFSIANTNNYLVGSAIVNYIVDNWSKFKTKY